MMLELEVSLMINALKVKEKLVETVLLSALTYQPCMLSMKYMLQKIPLFNILSILMDSENTFQVEVNSSP